ncbi:MAG: peptidoglycan editing factor PgeF, partial [Clostridia bacterium]|nr:peptidoglycan editing factor PgeF [Clostridia bacterium]
REGGVSQGPFASLNLHWSKEGCEADVLENYHRFSQGAGISYADMAIVNHAHGAVVLRLDASHRGSGFDKPPLPFCDGIITNDPAVALVTSHADCGAFFLYDPETRSIGMAHAGWKGTLEQIGLVMARAMEWEYGAKPADILAAAGPCICPKCFEVDEPLADQFVAVFAEPSLKRLGRPGKAYVDLPMCSAIQFLRAGIQPEHITLMDACTYETPVHFFSHRRDQGVTGSMAAFIQLR